MRVDVRMRLEGSMVGFTPVTRRAVAWINRNVEFGPWQWLGPTLWVDHGMAESLHDAIEREGLHIV